MSIVKNISIKSKTRRKRSVKSANEPKFIGLDEKNEEAERIHRLLKNPEVLRQNRINK